MMRGDDDTITRGSLRIVEVLALVSEPPRELVHHLLEDHAVHVLAEHVEQKPVTHLALFDESVDHLPLDQPESNVEQVGSHARG